MRSRFPLVALLAVVALTSPARAGFQFQFADASGSATSSFTVFQGSTVDVRVYLQATGTTDISTMRTDGLKAYGVELGFGPEAKVLATSDITSNAAFNKAETKFVTTSSAGINDSSTTKVLAGASEDRILLATFKFTG